MDRTIYLVTFLVLALMIAAFWIAGITDWIYEGWETLNETTQEMEDDID